MSCAKVTAMVFPMVVNPKDVNKYRRITMTEDSPRDSDVESLAESNNREAPVKYEMDSSLAEMKLNKGSQTDIMMYPPQYPPPPPPNQPPKGTGRDKRKVRMKESSSDDCYEKRDAQETENQCISRCENCSNNCASSSELDTAVCNEPVSETASSSEIRNERQQDPQPSEDSCAMECLYYAVQCSDCTLL